MGSRRGDADKHLNVAQVVPAIPAFPLDDGFAYSVPDGLTAPVGSIVRVPLGGRRVRGYVTGLRAADAAGLKPLAAVSSDIPIFDEGLLQVGRWAALHYVAPLATVLAKAAPPNLARRPAPAAALPVPAPSDDALARSLGEGARTRSAYLQGPGPWRQRVVALTMAVVAAGRSVIVLTSSVQETEAVKSWLDEELGDRTLLAHSKVPPAELTTSWARAATSAGVVLVGTREVALWPVEDIGLVILLGEGRRGMKDRSTPTLHVREIMRKRSVVERFPVVSMGAVPTTQALAYGVEVVSEPGRSWPLVEIVDRTEDPPGTGLITERTRDAIRAVVGGGGRVFVFSQVPGYASAVRCVSCRALRRCAACGAAASPGSSCERCQASVGDCAECGGRRFEALGAGVGRIKEILGRIVDGVGDAGTGSVVEVGSERDLLRATDVSLAVVLDGDGLALAPSYRAEEDALRLMARVAQSVGTGRGRRCLIQTAAPDHAVYLALRRGDPLEFLAAELDRRSKDGFPPAGELMIIEATGTPEGADSDLRRLAGEDSAVLGPVARSGADRWLVQGRDLRPFKVGLRAVIGRWREGQAKVRVDADPIDL